jgi:hypothetical protein
MPALALASIAGARPSAAAAILPPPGDAFYNPPDPLPAGRPGDIIWFRSVASPAAGSAAWQVLYLSTTAGGAPTAVSGTVLVPTSAYPGTRPIVAYAPGTQGWGPQCAPSKEMASGSFDEQFAVSNLLARGWAVVVTDYPGLGTPGPEAYNVGIPEGGYSQGGGAAG